jgi:hypothetical protein
MFYYTTVRLLANHLGLDSINLFQALQVVGLFGLQLQRLPAAIGALFYFILSVLSFKGCFRLLTLPASYSGLV